MAKVIVINGTIQYFNMFNKLGFEIVEDINEADLVCFTGGADVMPALYNESRHPKTHTDPARDDFEAEVFKTAKGLGKPMVGICRGGQFLHVMNKGRLFQHCNGHATADGHGATCLLTGEEITVTSTHHQMMMLNVGELVCVANETHWREWMNGNIVAKDYDPKDVEVVWHEETKCLCFQPHPEFHWTKKGAESTYLYFKNLLTHFFEEKSKNVS